MKQRVITALVLLALLAVVVWQIYTPLFIIVIAFLSAVASTEIMKCAKVNNKFLIVAGTLVAALIPFTASATIMQPWIDSNTWSNVISFFSGISGLIVIVIAYLLSMLKGYSHTKFEDVAITVMASIVVPYGFAAFGMLRDFGGEPTQSGVYFIFYGLICALGTDVGAQLGGMAFGKTKMSPNISPKKTVEGAVCGIIFSTVLNAVALLLFNHFADGTLDGVVAAVLLGLSPVVSFLGMMGDLSASVLKRNFDVKDFGKIFPGHGGVMDRFDSSLFTIPTTYFILTMILKLYFKGI